MYFDNISWWEKNRAFARRELEPALNTKRSDFSGDIRWYQKQTAVTAHLKSKQLLLFAFACQHFAENLFLETRTPQVDASHLAVTIKLHQLILWHQTTARNNTTRVPTGSAWMDPYINIRPAPGFSIPARYSPVDQQWARSWQDDPALNRRKRLPGSCRKNRHHCPQSRDFAGHLCNSHRCNDLIEGFKKEGWWPFSCAERGVGVRVPLNKSVSKCSTSIAWNILGFVNFNPLTAKLFNMNFHPLEVVSRWRDPQLQVSEIYSDLRKWKSTVFKNCWLMSHFNWHILI